MTAYFITMIVLHMMVVCSTIWQSEEAKSQRTPSQRLGRMVLYAAFVWWGFTLLVEHLQKGAA